MTIVSRADFVAAAGQGRAQDTRDLRLIIHHQDAFLIGHVLIGHLLRGLLSHDVNIHGRRVPEKLVDGV
jgi:hypothetical protein